MDKMKQTLFIKCILAEDSLKTSIALYGEGLETYLKRENYESLLDLVEDAGWYEEYRSFKIMAALYYAQQQQDVKRLANTA